MSGSEDERHVKARFDHPVKTFHKRKLTSSRKELPRGDMSIDDVPNPNTSRNSSDEDVEDETYIPSPRAPTHGKGKGLASASGSRATREEIEEEAADDDDGDMEEEAFDVEDILPPSYVDMGALVFRVPQNPGWRQKISYKGKTEAVREKRKIDARTLPRDAYDYRFHTSFQQDFYETVIIPKGKPVTNSQWIDWAYMENKHDPIFDRVIAACTAKHLRDVLAFKKDWNNEVIAQFYATLYVEEHDDTRKLHWMTEGQWYEVSYAQFARLLGFGRKDDSRVRIHMALKLDARKMTFMYPRSKLGNFGEITDMLPFYAYINRLFRRTLTPREGDGAKIPAYNKNILAAMASNANGFEFSVFDFIWEEIKAISENPLKSCGYAPYIMHMIERVTAKTCYCEKKHHPLRIKNDLKAPVEGRRAAAGQPGSPPPRADRRSRQQRNKPPSPIRKMLGLIFGMCKSQHAADVKAQHERRARRKDTKSVKEIHSHLNLQPPRSPIASEGEESPEIESFEERLTRYEAENPVQQWYGDTSFSGFGFGYGGVGSSSHPPPFDSPPAHTHHDEEHEESGDEDEDDE